jgi:hypothetical protein
VTLMHILAIALIAGPIVGNLLALLLRALGFTKAAAIVVQLTPLALYGVQFVDAELEQKPLPKPPTFPTALGVLLVGIAFLVLGIATAGCSATPQQIATGVTAIEDVGDATCAILEGIPQTDTTETQFICSAIPKPGASGPPKTMLVHVKNADAAKFASDHCVKAGSGAPTP